MARTIVELGKAWSGPQPDTAWIIEIDAIPGGGQSIGFAAKAGRSVSGPNIDMAAELARGAGTAKLKSYKGNNPKKPSALSLCMDKDVMLGIVLGSKLGATFDDRPFSGGYAGADGDYLGMTLVSPTTAYVVVPASKFGASYYKPFNIHLDVVGKNGNGEETVTQIILDPDTRLPPPGDGPP